MDQFVFTLKDNNQKAFNSFFWFLFFLHLIAAAVITFNASDSYQKNTAALSLVIFLVITAVFYLFKNKFKQKNYQLALFVVMVLFWLALAAWLPAIIVTIAIIFAFFILQKKSVAIFSAETIIITKSLFKKTYSWAEIQNAVLKDNLLSVDFKNNHLLQVEIADTNTSFDENTFNQFCKQQLNPKPLNS
jgi:hypothetical protein